MNVVGNIELHGLTHQRVALPAIAGQHQLVIRQSDQQIGQACDQPVEPLLLLQPADKEQDASLGTEPAELKIG